jgi:hypothetical protein
MRWIGAGLAVMLVAGTAAGCGSRARLVEDLIARFPEADIKRPNPDVFSVVDATLAGTTRRAVQANGPSRIGWKVAVPKDAWLEVAIGQREEAWTTEGDGVLFMIGVSDGATFSELMSLVVNPYAIPGDRTWHPLLLDLSVFAGKTVDLIFNTYSSPPDQPIDVRGDLPVWGEPRVVIR